MVEFGNIKDVIDNLEIDINQQFDQAITLNYTHCQKMMPARLNDFQMFNLFFTERVPLL
jgi:hypothetical protein